MKISAVILTKNEEKNIERVLKSVDFCDEIIVIDDYSKDKTIEIVHKVHKVYKVFQRELNGDFAGQKNFGMEKAKGDWILFIDADEEVSGELKEEIKTVIAIEQSKQPARLNACYLKRRDWWWGKELKYGETMKIRQKGLIRLMKKNSGQWKGQVHEELRIKNSELRIKTLNNYINHYPHPTVKDFLNDINFYSTLRAKELFKQNKKTNIFEIVFFPLGKFLYTYFIRLGFLDRAAGFAYAFMMSFHSFLVRAKLYQYREIDDYK